MCVAKRVTAAPSTGSAASASSKQLRRRATASGSRPVAPYECARVVNASACVNGVTHSAPIADSR